MQGTFATKYAQLKKQVELRHEEKETQFKNVARSVLGVNNKVVHQSISHVLRAYAVTSNICGCNVAVVDSEPHGNCVWQGFQELSQAFDKVETEAAEPGSLSESVLPKAAVLKATAKKEAAATMLAAQKAADAATLTAELKWESRQRAELHSLKARLKAISGDERLASPGQTQQLATSAGGAPTPTAKQENKKAASPDSPAESSAPAASSVSGWDSKVRLLEDKFTQQAIADEKETKKEVALVKEELRQEQEQMYGRMHTIVQRGKAKVQRLLKKEVSAEAALLAEHKAARLRDQLAKVRKDEQDKEAGIKKQLEGLKTQEQSAMKVADPQIIAKVVSSKTSNQLSDKPDNALDKFLLRKKQLESAEDTKVGKAEAEIKQLQNGVQKSSSTTQSLAASQAPSAKAKESTSAEMMAKAILATAKKHYASPQALKASLEAKREAIESEIEAIEDKTEAAAQRQEEAITAEKKKFGTFGARKRQAAKAKEAKATSAEKMAKAAAEQQAKESTDKNKMAKVAKERSAVMAAAEEASQAEEAKDEHKEEVMEQARKLARQREAAQKEAEKEAAVWKKAQAAKAAMTAKANAKAKAYLKQRGLLKDQEQAKASLHHEKRKAVKERCNDNNCDLKAEDQELVSNGAKLQKYIDLAQHGKGDAKKGALKIVKSIEARINADFNSVTSYAKTQMHALDSHTVKHETALEVAKEGADQGAKLLEEHNEQVVDGIMGEKL